MRLWVVGAALTWLSWMVVGCSCSDSERGNDDVPGGDADIVVSRPSGDTREDGGQAAFTVVLDSRPTADVVVHLESNDETEGRVDQTTLTFTPDNWNARQTVIVTGVDDELADGPQQYAIEFGETTSDDARYAGVVPAAVSLTNIDDDSPGITVTAIGGDTGEDGTQATFSVVLNSQPSAAVDVPLDTNDPSEGTVSATTLRFTEANWDAPQVVTVTGVDDELADGPQTYAIEFGATTSEDAGYAGLMPEPVSVVNLDDDSAGITVSEISGDTSEDGSPATFTVALNAAPTAPVTLGFEVSDASEASLGATSVTFTADNWNAPQEITVTGVDDDLVDGDQPYSIVFSASESDDAAYAGITPDAVEAVNLDNDSPGIVVSEISGATGENGTQATFSVVLRSEPRADVTLSFDTDDASEGTLDKTSVTFTPVNWRAPQIVTVTGVDDDVADGDQTYAIVFVASTSGDEGYAGITPENVTVTNVDNDSPGFAVSDISGDTGENGDQATFTVALNSRPAADVTVSFDSNDPTEGTVDVTTLTFTSENWSAPQTVTVTGQDDDVADGQQPYGIVFSATTSEDAGYAALTPTSVAVVNIDNDSAGITVSAVFGGTDEAGNQASFSVVLNSEPTADVTIALDSDDPTEGTVDRTSLTFTTQNWNAPQKVVVTGVDDDLADGNQPYNVVFSDVTSEDADYAALTPSRVELVNVDDESAGIVVGAVSGNTDEGGGQATFTVVLTSQPFADVTVNFGSNDATEGSTDVGSLTFTAENWDAPQVVTLTGTDDNVADGNQPYAIVFGATTSDDAAYAAIRPANLGVVNVDDDSAGIRVSAVTGQTGENGAQATFTVVLTSQPFADVTVNLSSNDTSEATVDRGSLTFTQDNWNAPQTVTLTGVDDDLADGDQRYSVVFAATTSEDAAYAAIRPGNIALTNLDNDSAGIQVSALSGDTRENGAQATFTVVLTSQPFADVTVNFASNDPSEATVDRTSLTFTSANWSAPQTVTVTGVDDQQFDGNQPFAIVFSTTSSEDAAYAAIRPSRVTGLNLDNDTAGILVSDISGNTGENGAQATFTVALTSQPFADVVVSFASNAPDEGITDVTSLTFTAANWNAPQTVTVTGVDDALADGNQPYAIVFASTTSEDAAYVGKTPGNLTLVNVDNDSAGIVVSAVSGDTGEGGSQATFTVALTSQPFAPVTVNFASNDAGEGTAAPTSLTFDASNWSTPQTVTVTGVNDDLADGNQPYAIVFAATTSEDPAYAAIRPANVALTNVDNDSAGISVSGPSGNTSEAAGTATFTVVLTSQPFADVTVSFDSNDATEGTVDRTSLTFTATNWSTPQTVTVTGVDDNVADGNQPYAVVFAATTSADAAYAAIRPANVNLTNVDNDVAGITVSAISGETSESGGTATFTVVLRSQPLSDVTVNFNSSDTTEGIVQTNSLTFTSLNWNVPQTVTVVGVDDTENDCEVVYSIVFSATTSADPAYTAVTPSSVRVVNRDNDTGGLSGYCVAITEGQTSTPGICQPWLDYTASLSGTFSSVILSGSNDTVGRTCSDPTAATQICNALQTRTTTQVSCGGRTWYVGFCGIDQYSNPGVELSVDTPICTCAEPGYTLRPCIRADCSCNTNVGGLGTRTCNTPTQTMSFRCIR